MEAPVSKLVLTRAISQAVNEMHDASFISAIKALKKAQEAAEMKPLNVLDQPSERLKEIDPELYDALQNILSVARAARGA